MARNTSVSLDEHFANFVEEQVDKGLYESASDVVSAGLQLLEEQDAQVKALEAALIEGEKGPFTPFDPETFIAEMHRKYPG